ncbi:MAG: homogentisate 1,2-dioxygenase, partial [Bacteroidetes bacterium]|nr:homogentisate 1,2-dioxygenase [Bacteroidota bacterium]
MYYCRRGDIPPKRHIQFRQPDGSLYQEELVSSRGFSGIYSNLYHIHPPTRVKHVGKPQPFGSRIREDYPLLQTHLKTSAEGLTGKDYLQGRRVLLKNRDIAIGICNLPAGNKMDYFYKNAEADEVIYIHDGAGRLLSQFGELRVRKGDYVVIPRTTIYKFEFDNSAEMVRLLVTEAASPIETPARYRNELGQLQ